VPYVTYPELLSNRNPSEKEKFRYNITRVNNWVSTALENGLFKVQNTVSYKTILDKLRNAEESLERRSPPDFIQSDYELNSAAAEYFSAIHATKLGWRLKNIYAFHLFVYLGILLFTVFILYNNFHIDGLLAKTLNVPVLATNAVTWGVIGSILRGFWALWTNISDRSYRNAWSIWFLSLPFIGGILGAMVYLAIFAGVIVASSGGTNKAPLSLNPLVVIVLCAFAGFNWQWAMEQIEKLRNLRS
jgi:hypothetical protein